MKRLLLLMPLVARTASSVTLSEADCLALVETREILRTRRVTAVKAAIEIQNSSRFQKIDEADCKPARDDWDECVQKVKESEKVDAIEILQSTELNLLAGESYGDSNFMINERAAQLKIEESRELMKKARNITQKMNKGECVLS